MYEDISMKYRKILSGGFMLTENGNLLLDVWFTTLPTLAQLNITLKTITGVVETSSVEQFICLKAF